MTKPTPTVDIDPQASWMSPSRVEHQSKFVESVIFGPQPRIMLGQSTYKVTSFIDFMPYREAFKRFETFFRKFKNNINDPDHVGPFVRSCLLLQCERPHLQQFFYRISVSS